ncbi:single-stranded DNA-binding protein [Megamonas rupellensis]|uniref:Single-stranded DNA-binding protein n=1 Tax=Megamonas rupellensis TaxID=491921 RepID=A0A412CBI5_9FIRM|nr:ERF family protein [Megamonas rupellensis]RGQ77031.1 single-stranded DNA-binding protein [Megamonas rupellensis]
MENTKIAKKLVNVMIECGHIAKNGLNSYHQYKYATAEDVLLKVNSALTKNKIASVVIPEIASMVDVTNLKGNTEHLVTVNVQIKLIDSESGECVDLFGIGSGQDAGDKAVMKAQTAAIKYAYMMSLCIATGDDPEADTKTDENSSIGNKGSKIVNNVKKISTIRKSITVCANCGEEITSDRVVQFSMARYNKPLCMDCQKQMIKTA